MRTALSRTAPFLFASACGVVLPAAAFAHGGAPHPETGLPEGPRNRGELWWAWAWEPGVIVSLAVGALLYGWGLAKLWRAAGVGRGVRRWEAASFLLGWLSLVVALVSPLHLWGNMLFSAHMSQHEVLMLISAPLLVLGKPVVATLKALPAGYGRRLVRLFSGRVWTATWTFITHPFVAWLLHGIVLWVWHLPVLFEATLHDEWVHAFQHASFLVSALLFWFAVVHGPHHLSGYGMAVLYFFTTALHSGLLGLLITFATTVWYPAYERTAPLWNLTPLEDQQLGGLIMWVPACSMYVVAGLAFFAAWLNRAGEQAERHARDEAWRRTSRPAEATGETI